jgi:hypothetical protein
MASADTDPDRYVRENRETLVRIIKHGNDDFVRALALAAIVEYGGEPEVETLRRELNRLDELEGSA